MNGHSNGHVSGEIAASSGGTHPDEPTNDPAINTDGFFHNKPSRGMRPLRHRGSVESDQHRDARYSSDDEWNSDEATDRVGDSSPPVLASGGGGTLPGQAVKSVLGDLLADGQSEDPDSSLLPPQHQHRPKHIHADGEPSNASGAASTDSQPPKKAALVTPILSPAPAPTPTPTPIGAAAVLSSGIGGGSGGGGGSESPHEHALNTVSSELQQLKDQVSRRTVHLLKLPPPLVTITPTRVSQPQPPLPLMPLSTDSRAYVRAR